MLERLRLQGLLSYPPDAEAIELGPLNVVIGPNTSGKSNLIKALSLLKALPDDLSAAVRQGGRATDWTWKGQGAKTMPVITAEISPPFDTEKICYEFSFGEGILGDIDLYYEKIITKNNKKEETVFHSKDLQLIKSPFDETNKISKEEYNYDFSLPAISQFKGPLYHKGMYHISSFCSNLLIYEVFKLLGKSALRTPQKPDFPGNVLFSTGENLALVINRISNDPKQFGRFLDCFRKFWPEVSDIRTIVEGGSVALYVHESGMETPISAYGLSDGTLNFMCLLAILLSPQSLSLICIEEPEVGLHPDVLPLVAELLVEASERNQIIVTTHSDILVSAFSDRPECVLVCERDERGSHLRRLEKKDLTKWLEDYSLGELWRMGEIGGNRW